MRRCIEAWRVSPGPHHQSYASAVATLALVLSRTHPDESARLFRETLGVLQTRLGERHTFVGEVMLEYARHLESHGRKEQGKEWKQHARAILSDVSPRNGPGHTIDALELGK